MGSIAETTRVARMFCKTAVFFRQTFWIVWHASNLFFCLASIDEKRNAKTRKTRKCKRGTRETCWPLAKKKKKKVGADHRL